MNSETKSHRGCCFYILVIGGLLLAIILIATIAGVTAARKMLNEYTELHPVQLPALQMSKSEIEALQERVAAFQQGIRQHRPTAPLALTADDLNALIATMPAGEPFRGKIYFRIEGNRLKGDLSLPMASLGLGIFKGRYLNGTAIFQLELRDGHLQFSPQSLLVKGKMPPKPYMDMIRRENLAQKLNADPRVSMGLDQLQSIHVENGKLVLVPRITR